MVYTPPSGDSVVLNWTGASYTPPDGDSVVIEFSPASPDDSYVVGATVGDTLSVSDASIENLTKSVFPGAIPPQSVGIPRLVWQQFIRAQGFSALGAGGPATSLRLRILSPSPIPPIVAPQPYVSGGVKIVSIEGVQSDSFGVPKFYDELLPPPIGSLIQFGVAAVATTPGIWPLGIRSDRYGEPSVWRFPYPEGFLSYRSGTHTIDYGLHALHPSGFDSYEPSPSVIRDRAQTIRPSETGYSNFGDVFVRGARRFIQSEGFDTATFRDYLTVRNTRRLLTAKIGDMLEAGNHEIVNNTPSLFPTGIDLLAFGEAFVSHFIRRARPSGNDFVLFGSPTVKGTPALFFNGITRTAVGEPSVSKKHRQIETQGSVSDKHGTALVTFTYRVLRVGAGIYQAVFEENIRVEHGVRTVETIASYPGLFFGNSRIDRAIRYVSPASIKPPDLVPQTVYGPRKLGAFGFDSQRFGNRILPEYSYIVARGFQGDIGSPEVRNINRRLFPLSFKTGGSEEWMRHGANRVHNLRQIVAQYFDDASYLYPLPFPPPTIANRNRAISTIGAATNKHGLALIENAGRALLVTGIDAPKTGEFYKAGSVTHKIRYVKPDIIEPRWFSPYAAVYNAARVLAPSGYSAQGFGDNISAKNTRRYYIGIGKIDSAKVAEPMISFRIRTLVQNNQYAYPPDIKMPDIQLLKRYVDVAGNDYQKIGHTDLVIRWTIVRPTTSPMTQYGYPALKNLTPELHAYGYNHAEFGDTKTRTQWRTMFANGSLMQQFGNTRIADRKFRVNGHGFAASDIGKVIVEKTASPPYSLQYILLNDIDSNGNGYGIDIPTYPWQVSIPAIKHNGVYPEGFDAAKFDEARVTANTIRVEPGYYEFPIGEHEVSLKTRTIAVKPYPDPPLPSPAALSPRTIWAVNEPPQQAKDNHISQPIHYVDGYGGRSPGITLGYPAVVLQHRRLTVRNLPATPPTRYGNPEIFNRLSFVAVNGIQSMRIGWVSTPVDKKLTQFDPFDGAMVGLQSVRRSKLDGPQNISMNGYAATQFGLGTHIDLFNRQIHPPGLHSLRMGESSQFDVPYTWMSLHVGPPMPTIPVGTDMAIIGTQFISLRVRDIAMTGYDAFLCEYELEAFDKRIRITRGAKTLPVLSITPIGISAEQYAVPNIKPAVRYIRPDGNADQYRKGASHV